MELSIREQAAQWVTELDDPAPGVRARFAAWLQESPRHVEEFLFLDSMWHEFGRVDGEQRIEVGKLVEQARAEANKGKVVRMQPHVTPVLSAPGRGGNMKWAAVVAAAGIGLGFVWWSMQGMWGGKLYTTALGEQRAVKLEDGSFVYLNTRSQIEVRFDEKRREVRLLEGEALFQVERDAARPFQVLAGAAQIQVLGTEFNVYRRLDSTTVSVIEGAVGIPAGSGQAARLSAGEEARVTSEGRVIRHEATDVDRAVAWRERRLVFRSEVLGEVAAQFNRYNARKIRVEGEAVQARRLIGTFDADDPESLVQFLAQEKDLVVERGENALTIRAR